MPTQFGVHPRLLEPLLPHPERPPDWQPTISEEPGFFEQLPDRARRGINTLYDAVVGETPEQRLQTGVETMMAPLTAASAARRSLRPLLSGNLTPGLKRYSQPGARPPTNRDFGQHRLDRDTRAAESLTLDDWRYLRRMVDDPFLQEAPPFYGADPATFAGGSPVAQIRLPEQRVIGGTDAWEKAHRRMQEVMKKWSGSPTPAVREELNDLVTNTEFGKHYLARLQRELRNVYPSGRVPLYRGLGHEELGDVFEHMRRLRSGESGLTRDSPMVQSFSLSPNMARKFAGDETYKYGPGTVLYGDVPIENVRGHHRSTLMNEEELMVDALADVPVDWRVAPGRQRGRNRPHPNWGQTKALDDQFWQDLLRKLSP